MGLHRDRSICALIRIRSREQTDHWRAAVSVCTPWRFAGKIVDGARWLPAWSWRQPQDGRHSTSVVRPTHREDDANRTLERLGTVGAMAETRRRKHPDAANGGPRYRRVVRVMGEA